MHRFTVRRKLTGIALTFGLMAGSLGMGVALAQWMSQKSATETITVNGMSVTIAAIHGTLSGGNVVCDPVAISSPTGTQPFADACGFSLTPVGGVAPATLTVTMTSDLADYNIAVGPAAFYGPAQTIVLNGALQFHLTTAPQTLLTSTTAATIMPAANPLTFQIPVDWGSILGGTAVDIGPADFGAVLHLSYSISVTAA